MSAQPASPIEALPNEIVNTILTHLPVKDTLCCTAVNRHFHELAVRDLFQRLIKTGSLDDYELILECYHPSLKVQTPYLSCRYIDTWIADDTANGTRKPVRDEFPTHKDLHSMYSSFLPVVTEENRRRRFRMLWPGAAAAIPTASGSVHMQEIPLDEEASEQVFLDEGELFSQLYTVTNVVKEGKKRGFFPSHVNISENVIRIFRRWLNKQASRNDSRETWNKVPIDSDTILWTDTDKSIGLRLHITLGAAERMPILSSPDDDAPVSFHMIYEELIVRTSKLLQAVETANQEQVDPSGRGLIVSSLYDTDSMPAAAPGI